MKGRLVAAVFCILLAFSMSVGSEVYIVGKSETLIQKLDLSLSAADGSREMYKTAIEACEEWDGCETLFGSLLKHSDADDLDHAYSLIREYVKSESVDELKETLEECKVTIKVIADGEKPRIENIF